MRLLISPTSAHTPPDSPSPATLASLNEYPYSYTPGIGATPLQMGETIGSIAATGITATTAILSSLATSSAVAAGGIAADATIMGLSATVVPIIGAAIGALIVIGIAVANMFKGCGQTCIAATSLANQADALMTRNVDTYTSSPIRYVSMQQAALNTFDVTWAALQRACSDPNLQSAGERCITDRQQGACKWKASPGGWNSDGTYTKFGPAGSGDACWNWFVGMRDPIADDPFVLPDPVASPTATMGTSPTSNTNGSPSILSGVVQLGGVQIPTLGLVGAGLLALVLFTGGEK